MVLAVCRRRLGQAQDAEDAAQAVFLALARGATRVRKRSSNSVAHDVGVSMYSIWCSARNASPSFVPTRCWSVNERSVPTDAPSCPRRKSWMRYGTSSVSLSMSYQRSAGCGTACSFNIAATWM